VGLHGRTAARRAEAGDAPKAFDALQQLVEHALADAERDAPATNANIMDCYGLESAKRDLQSVFNIALQLTKPRRHLECFGIALAALQLNAGFRQPLARRGSGT
jgi:hypothetical protein